MKFIANGVNGEYPENLLHLVKKEDVEEIKVAIAYASGFPKLFEYAWDNRIKLTYWGRYDDSTPVTVPILESFLKRGSSSLNYRCFLVPDILHAKVIWFVGQGVYIGSANLSDRAWVGNIEAGVFFSQSEMIQNGLVVEMQTFFDHLRERSYPLTREVYDEIAKLESDRSSINREKRRLREQFQKARSLPVLEPLTLVSKKAASTKRKEAFLKEWNSTLQILRDMADIVAKPENRPAWVQADVPKGALCDQFLHAFYYVRVRNPENKQTYLYEEFHERNRHDRDLAFNDALSWWRSLKEAPENEDEMLHVNAVRMRTLLAKERLMKMTDDEFKDICSMIHAFRGVARQTENAALDLPEGTYMPLDERVRVLGAKLLSYKARNGMQVRDVLSYLLYGGPNDGIVDRIWNVAFEPDYHIDRFGLSCVGETVGWALPDLFPPRNGRTSKALFALGNDVTIHTV